MAVAARELSMFFRELLELRYPGWLNAEGSRGEFEWELVRDELTHAGLCASASLSLIPAHVWQRLGVARDGKDRLAHRGLWEADAELAAE
jgi:hypothetical protein